jgi:hypothetical protein
MLLRDCLRLFRAQHCLILVEQLLVAAVGKSL